MLENAIHEIDESNRQDPRMQTVGGITHPREWIFAQTVSKWVERLNPTAPESVRLAARGHTLRRWEIPRDRYPMDTAGYHEWRKDTAKHSAKWTTEILMRVSYPEEMIQAVRKLITREIPPNHPDAQLLEDADCLAFLEIKLDQYLSAWDDQKMERILHGTWRKMSPEAHQAAQGLPLDNRIKKIISRF
ncbi:MAG TPA: DUF4202 domain-containing protein [Nitrospiria bacterium]